MKAVNNYLKNVMKSVAYSAADYGKAQDLKTVNFVAANKDFLVSTYTTLRNPSAKLKKSVQSMQNSKVYQALDYGVRNVFEDLKTGNWYNKEREDRDSLRLAGLDDIGSDDFGFDFDDDDLITKKNSGPAKEDKITSGDLKIVGAIEGSNAAAANATVNAVLASSEANMRNSRANMAMLYSQNEKLFGGLHKDMTVLGQTMNEIYKMASTTLHNIDKNTSDFFTQELKLSTERNAILKEMLEMQRNQYKSASQKELEAARKRNSKSTTMRWSDINSGDSGDLNKYFEGVRKNIANEFSGMFGMPELSENGNMLATFMVAPMRYVTNFLINKAIPESMKESTKHLDNTVNSVFGQVIGRLANGKNKDGIFGLVSKFLGIDTSISKVNTSRYEKGPVPFDGITRKAIIDVIPTYLRRIEATLSGRQEEVFDYDSGRWKKMSEVKRSIDQIKKSAIDRSTKGIVTDMMRDSVSLKTYRARIQSQLDKEGFELALQEFQLFLYENHGIFNPKRSAEANGIHSYDSEYQNLYEHYDAIAKAFHDYDFMAPSQLTGKRRHSRTSQKLGLASQVMSAREYENRQYRNMEQTGVGAMMQFFAVDGSYDKHGKTGKNGQFNPYAAWLNIQDEYGNNVFNYLQGITRELIWQRNNWAAGGSGGSGDANSPQPTSGGGSGIPFLSNNDINLTSRSNRAQQNREWSNQQRADQRVAREAERLADENIRMNRTDNKKKSMLAKILDRSKTGGFINALSDTAVETYNNALFAADQAIYDMFFKAELRVDGDTEHYSGFMDMISNKINKTFESISQKADDITDKIKSFFVDKLKEHGWNTEDFKKQFGGVFKDAAGWVKRQYQDVYGPGVSKIRDLMDSPEQRAAREKQRRYDARREELRSSRAERRASAAYRTSNARGIYSLLQGPDGEIDNILLNEGMRFDRGASDSANSVIDAIQRNETLSDEEKRSYILKINRILSNPNIKDKTKAIKNVATKIKMRGAAMGGSFAKLGPAALSKGELTFTRRGIGRVPKTGIYNISEPTHILNSRDSAKLMGEKPTSTISEDLRKENFAKKKYTDQITNHAEGTIRIGNEEVDLSGILGYLKQNAGKVAGGGALGAIVSTLFGLVGGPLVGGAVGAGTMLLKDSEAFKNILFGKAAENGERAGGIISKSVQDTVKKYAPDMLKYGVAGVLPGLLTPFGPVGGLLIGSAVGFIKNSESVRDRLFGENGIKFGDKEKNIIKKMLPNTLKGAGAGALATLLLPTPFGLLGNAAIGAAMGMMTTSDEFKEGLLGRMVNGIRMGGVVNHIKDAFSPLMEAAENFKDKTNRILDENIIQPLNDFIVPFVHELPRIAGFIPRKVNELFQFAWQKSLRGILAKPLNWIGTRALGAAGKAADIVTTPFRTIVGGAGNKLRAAQIRRGTADYMTAEERLDFMRRKGKSGYEGQATDEALMNIGSGEAGSLTVRDAKDTLQLMEDITATKGNLRNKRKNLNKNINSLLESFVASNGKTLSRGTINKIGKAVQKGNVGAVRRILQDAGLSGNDIEKLMGEMGLENLVKDYRTAKSREDAIRGRTAEDRERMVSENGALFESLGIDSSKFLSDNEYAKRIMANLRTEIDNRKANGADEESVETNVNNINENVVSITGYLKALVEHTLGDNGAALKSYEDANQIHTEARRKEQEALDKATERERTITGQRTNLINETFGEGLNPEIANDLTGVQRGRFARATGTKQNNKNVLLAQKMEKEGVSKDLATAYANALGVGADYTRITKLIKLGYKLSVDAAKTVTNYSNEKWHWTIKFLKDSVVQGFCAKYEITGADINTIPKNHSYAEAITVIADCVNSGTSIKAFGSLANAIKSGTKDRIKAQKAQAQMDEDEYRESDEDISQYGIGTFLLGGLGSLASAAINGVLGIGKGIAGGAKTLLGGLAGKQAQAPAGESLVPAANSVGAGGGIGAKLGGMWNYIAGVGHIKSVQKPDGSMEEDTSDPETKETLNKLSLKEKIAQKAQAAQAKASSLISNLLDPKQQKKGIGILGMLLGGLFLAKTGILKKLFEGVILPLWDGGEDANHEGGIKGFLIKTAWPEVKAIGQWIWTGEDGKGGMVGIWNDHIKPFMSDTVAPWITDTAIPKIGSAIGKIMGNFATWLGQNLWNIIKGSANFVGNFFDGVLSGPGGGNGSGTTKTVNLSDVKDNEEGHSGLKDENYNYLTAEQVKNGEYKQLYDEQNQPVRTIKNGDGSVSLSVTDKDKPGSYTTQQVGGQILRSGLKGAAGAKTITGFAYNAASKIAKMRGVVGLAGKTAKALTSTPNAAERFTSKTLSAAAKKAASGSIDDIVKVASGSVDDVIEVTTQRVTNGVSQGKVSKLFSKFSKFFFKKEGEKSFLRTITDKISEGLSNQLAKLGPDKLAKIKSLAKKATAIFAVADFLDGMDRAEVWLSAVSSDKKDIMSELPIAGFICGLVKAGLNFIFIGFDFIVKAVAQFVTNAICKLIGYDLKAGQEMAKELYEEYQASHNNITTKTFDEWLESEYSIRGSVKSCINNILQKIGKTLGAVEYSEEYFTKQFFIDGDSDFISAKKNIDDYVDPNAGYAPIQVPKSTMDEIMYDSEGNIRNGFRLGTYYVFVPKGTDVNNVDFSTFAAPQTYGNPSKSESDIANYAIGTTTLQNLLGNAKRRLGNKFIGAGTNIADKYLGQGNIISNGLNTISAIGNGILDKGEDFVNKTLKDIKTKSTDFISNIFTVKQDEDEEQELSNIFSDDFFKSADQLGPEDIFKNYVTTVTKISSIPFILTKNILRSIVDSISNIGAFVQAHFSGIDSFLADPLGFIWESVTGRPVDASTNQYAGGSSSHGRSQYMGYNGTIHTAAKVTSITSSNRGLSSSTISSSRSGMFTRIGAAARRIFNRISTTGRGKYTKQIDPSISNIRFNTSGDHDYQTIGDSACGPAAAVNILESMYGRGTNPLVAASDFAISRGYKEQDGGTKPGFFSDYFNQAGYGSNTTYNRNKLASSIASGKPTILMGQDKNGVSNSTPFGRNPHYVAVTGVDRSGKAIVQDPESRYDDQLYDIKDLMKKTTLGTSIYGASKFGRSKWGRRVTEVAPLGTNGNTAVRIFLGDSLTDGMHDVADPADGTIFVCKIGAGLSWAKSTGCPRVDQLTQEYKSKGGTKVVILLGTNDDENYRMDTTYANYFNNKAKTWRANGATVYFVSILPYYGKYKSKNSLLRQLNNSIKNQLNGILYVDVFDESEKLVSDIKGGDGCHYRNKDYKQIYEWIKAKVGGATYQNKNNTNNVTNNTDNTTATTGDTAIDGSTTAGENSIQQVLNQGRNNVLMFKLKYNDNDPVLNQPMKTLTIGGSNEPSIGGELTIGGSSGTGSMFGRMATVPESGSTGTAAATNTSTAAAATDQGATSIAADAANTSTQLSNASSGSESMTTIGGFFARVLANSKTGRVLNSFLNNETNGGQQATTAGAATDAILTGSTAADNSGQFPAYQLTESQIKGLANIVSHEQGDKAGKYAEASLMANLTDIKGDDRATTENLIKRATSGWFAHGKSRFYNPPSSVDSTSISAVKDVIVGGKRTIPRYVNEHDCFSDLTSAKNNGSSITIRDKSQYQQHVTKIHNRYGSDWTFYTFPGPHSDPFGYTSNEYRNKWGDSFYSVEAASGSGQGGNGYKPISKYGRANTNLAPITSNAADKVASTDQGLILWHYLKSQGLPDNAIAGILGNIEAESGVDSGSVETLFLQRNKERNNYYNLEGSSYKEQEKDYTKKVDAKVIDRHNFVHPFGNKQYGYGLVQFTSPDGKEKLWDRSVGVGKSISDLSAQTEVMLEEMKTDKRDGQALWSILTNPNVSVHDASDAVLYIYERPGSVNHGKNTAEAQATFRERRTMSDKMYQKYKDSTYNGGFTNMSSVLGNTSNGATNSANETTTTVAGYFANLLANSKVARVLNSFLSTDTGGGDQQTTTTANTATDGAAVSGDGVTASGSAKALVDTAIAELGNPSSRGNDKNKYNNYDGQYWCASFVSWVAKHSGNADRIGQSASASALQDIAEKKPGNKRIPGNQAQPGDIITFWRDREIGGDHRRHIGIIEKRTGGKIHTIEGNTTADGVSDTVGRHSYPEGNTEHSASKGKLYVTHIEYPNTGGTATITSGGDGTETTGVAAGEGGNGYKPLSKYGTFTRALYGRGSYNTDEESSPVEPWEIKRQLMVQKIVHDKYSDTGSSARSGKEGQYGRAATPVANVGTVDNRTNIIKGSDRNYSNLINTIIKVLMTIADNTDKLNLIVTILNKKLGTDITPNDVNDAASKQTLKSKLKASLNSGNINTATSKLDSYANDIGDYSINSIINAMNAIASE